MKNAITQRSWIFDNSLSYICILILAYGFMTDIFYDIYVSFETFLINIFM